MNVNVSIYNYLCNGFSVNFRYKVKLIQEVKIKFKVLNVFIHMSNYLFLCAIQYLNKKKQKTLEW